MSTMRHASQTGDIEAFRNILLTDKYTRELENILPGLSGAELLTYWQRDLAYAAILAANINDYEMTNILVDFYGVDRSEIHLSPPEQQILYSLTPFKHLCYLPNEPRGLEDGVSVEFLEISDTAISLLIDIQSCGQREYVFEKRMSYSGSYWIASSVEYKAIY